MRPYWFWRQTKVESTPLIRLARLVHWVVYAGAALVFALAGIIMVSEIWACGTLNWPDFLTGIFTVALIAGAGRGARYVVAGE